MMQTLIWLTSGALAVAASAASAQATPQSHEQHQATGQHQIVDGKGKCCCEEMMHRMMKEMMQKHQDPGKAHKSPGDGPQGHEHKSNIQPG